MGYKFAILDARPLVFASTKKFLAQNLVLGIEVTMPELADLCSLGNIDPQHSDSGVSGEVPKVAPAAIEVALTTELPPDGAILATIRADLDSIGAMALLQLRQLEGHVCPSCSGWGVVPSDTYGGIHGDADVGCQTCGTGFYGGSSGLHPGLEARIGQIATSDKFARGSWPGPRPVPPTSPVADSSCSLSAIASAVADFNVPIADRVAWAMQWLLAGVVPDKYHCRVKEERAELIRALNRGDISSSLEAGGKVAVVVSGHRAATSIGYCLAPVVVALNPEFRFQGKSAHRKFTVCQFETGWVDLPAVCSELASIEPGWGGSPTICGSPQGVGSVLGIDEVLEVVSRHLKK